MRFSLGRNPLFIRCLTIYTVDTMQFHLMRCSHEGTARVFMGNVEKGSRMRAIIGGRQLTCAALIRRLSAYALIALCILAFLPSAAALASETNSSCAPGSYDPDGQG